MWFHEGLLSAKEILAEFNKFVIEHPIDLEGAPKHHHTDIPLASKKMDDLTEEEQMALVIEQSLKEQNGSAPPSRAPSVLPSSKPSIIYDSDSDSENFDADSDKGGTSDQEEESLSRKRSFSERTPLPSRSSSSATPVIPNQSEEPAPKRSKLQETEVNESEALQIEEEEEAEVFEGPPDCTLQVCRPPRMSSPPLLCHLPLNLPLLTFYPMISYQIRLPDGKSVTEQFRGSQRLRAVALFVSKQLGTAPKFALATTFPRRRFEASELGTLTLKEACA